MSDAPGQGGGRAPTPEELAQALADRLASVPVRDVMFQTMATFVDLAGIRLGFGPRGEEVRDLPQARQAIETLRALLGVAERELGVAHVRPFKEPLAQLQIAYARAVEGGGGERDDGEGEGPSGGGGPQPPPGEPPPRPAGDPASRLWVPPGARR